MRQKRHIYLFLLTAVGAVIGGCDQKNKDPLQGTRETVLITSDTLLPDQRAKELKVTVPQGIHNHEWSQASGAANHVFPPVWVSEKPVLAWSESIGQGSGGEQRLLNGPVAAEGKVYTMDVEGQISAFSIKDGTLVWKVDARPEHGFGQLFSGGLAYENKKIFASTAGAEVLCLDAIKGDVKWRTYVTAPVRSAPTVKDGRVYVISINNQLEVLDAQTGKVLWTHNGIIETAGLLGGANTAIAQDVAIVPYSSGEVFALKSENGYALWSESLNSYTRVDSIASLAHIKARPVVSNRKVFLISHGGKLSAISLTNGQTLWSREVGGIRSPAVAGNFLFLVTNDNQLVCLTQEEGWVVWVKKLPQLQDPEAKKDKILWAGPILVNQSLLIAGSNSQALLLSVKDGSVQHTLQLPGPTLLSPIVADKTVFFLLENGTLAAFR